MVSPAISPPPNQAQPETSSSRSDPLQIPQSQLGSTNPLTQAYVLAWKDIDEIGLALGKELGQVGFLKRRLGNSERQRVIEQLAFVLAEQEGPGLLDPARAQILEAAVGKPALRRAQRLVSDTLLATLLERSAALTPY